MPQRKLLLYTPLAHKAGHRLEEAVVAVLPEGTAEVVRTAAGLARRLRSPRNGLEVAVIMATGRKKLEELQPLEQMLESLLTILILPDAAPRTIARAHKLRPRYVTDIRSDFQDVAAVLKKMLALPELPLEPTTSF
jgi:hypothetical protein